MCHQIWKILLEDGDGGAETLLLRSGMPTGFQPPGHVAQGMPRPHCELTVDPGGAITLSAWFDGKNMRPASPLRAGERVQVGTSVFSIKAPPVEVADGKLPCPRDPERPGSAAASRRARLRFENLDPENIQFVGPVGDRFELDPARPCTIGIVPEADVQIIGASIGGRRNSRLRFDGTRGCWTLLHLGHGCPIYLNGEDISELKEVVLRDGDCFEPGGQPGVHIRFDEGG